MVVPHTFARRQRCVGRCSRRGQPAVPLKGQWQSRQYLNGRRPVALTTTYTDEREMAPYMPCTPLPGPGVVVSTLAECPRCARRVGSLGTDMYRENTMRTAMLTLFVGVLLIGTQSCASAQRDDDGRRDRARILIGSNDRYDRDGDRRDREEWERRRSDRRRGDWDRDRDRRDRDWDRRDRRFEREAIKRQRACEKELWNRRLRWDRSSRGRNHDWDRERIRRTCERWAWDQRAPFPRGWWN